ncbi:MAG TPA: NlpC/P60 family protein [Dermatophilaceae bacterium]|nr:NlpC/P60 family protein [Dermatophilaceae bacterium]
MPHRLSARRARELSLVAVLAAAVAVPTLGASPAQAYVAKPTVASGVSTIGAVTRTSTGPAGSVGSAALAAKPKGAKAVAKKKRTGLTPSRILSAARKYDGSFYRYGGTTPAGFDCSGYTRYVFAKLGRSLPHNSSAQRSKARHVSRGNARPGDLIFFHSSSGRIYHVGIYAGGRKLYHASKPGVRTGLAAIYSSRVTFGRV